MRLKSLIKSKKPVLMGILNITPDSFSDGGIYYEKSMAIDRAFEMEALGADIIDIGGESTKPGSDVVQEEEELRRVMPVIQAIRSETDILISIDTTKSEVARQAIEAGANLINDVSAGRFDDEMFHLAASKNVPICLMHMKGKPKTMQQNPVYEDLIGEIGHFLKDVVMKAKKAGVQNVLIDPGIGFGKSADDNVEILKRLDELILDDTCMLIGTSRKSFIGNKLGLDVKDRLEPTLATLYLAYQRGATWFRIHDVGSARRFLDTVVMLENKQ